MCAVYCLDSQFVSETPKFIAGSLQALAAMVQLELPHVNVLTKVDLIADKVKHKILYHLAVVLERCKDQRMLRTACLSG